MIAQVQKFSVNWNVAKFVVAPVVAALAILLFANVSQASTASHIYVGDVNVTCNYGGVVHGAFYDSDGASGQVVEVRDCPTVKAESPYGFSWVGHSQGNVKAAINDVLATGCGNADGCASVRYFVITSQGVQSYVINTPYPMTPSAKLSVSNGKAYNEKYFYVEVQDVGLWTHCLKFGDDTESCFDGSDTKITIPHFFHWKGGTFTATLIAKLPNGSTVSQQVKVTIPHP